jgi:hypothetical protein
MMDIQKIYLKQAHLFLNSSLFALLPTSILIFIIIVFIPSKNLMVFVVPFIIYSLFLFQNYLLNYKRYISLSNKIVTTDLPSLLSCPQILLYFVKEDNELVFLHPTGAFLGKISENKQSYSIHKGNKLHPKEFILIDSNESLLATYRKSDTLDVYRSDKSYFGGYSNGVFSMLTGEEMGKLSSKKFFWDDKIKTVQGEVVFRVRKGWMPIKYQEIFLNPNTPYVTIDPALSESEKLILISFLVKKFFN